MPCETYRALIGAICLATDSPPPRAHDGADIGVGGTHFTIRHGGEAAPGVMMIYADFGELPAHARESAMLHLLESNLYMSSGGYHPCFAYNPETRHVVLVSACELERTSAAQALNTLACYAAIADEWRQAYSLGRPQRHEPAANALAQRYASI